MEDAERGQAEKGKTGRVGEVYARAWVGRLAMAVVAISRCRGEAASIPGEAAAIEVAAMPGEAAAMRGESAARERNGSRAFHNSRSKMQMSLQSAKGKCSWKVCAIHPVSVGPRLKARNKGAGASCVRACTNAREGNVCVSRVRAMRVCHVMRARIVVMSSVHRMCVGRVRIAALGLSVAVLGEEARVGHQRGLLRRCW